MVGMGEGSTLGEQRQIILSKKFCRLLFFSKTADVIILPQSFPFNSMVKLPEFNHLKISSVIPFFNAVSLSHQVKRGD